MVGPSRSRVYHKRRATRDIFNSGSKSLKRVTRGEKPIVGLGFNYDTRSREARVGFRPKW